MCFGIGGEFSFLFKIMSNLFLKLESKKVYFIDFWLNCSELCFLGRMWGFLFFFLLLIIVILVFVLVSIFMDNLWFSFVVFIVGV